MKPAWLLRCLLFAMITGLAAEAKSQTNTVSSSIYDGEQFEVKITKVYSASDGPSKYRAYAVNWKGQEIVVVDRGSSTSYKEGQTISVYVSTYRSGGGEDVLSFSLSWGAIKFRK